LERHQIKQKKREKLSFKITKKNGYTRRATLNNIFDYGKVFIALYDEKMGT